MENQQESYGIPRLHKLGYLEVALAEVAKGASFDRIRQGLIAFAAKQHGEDRVVGSRFQDAYTLWSPTQEALAELMRLGFVAEVPLPSERQYVDGHRTQAYTLTAVGATAAGNLASQGAEDRAAFLDELSVALAEAHPGFARILAIVENHPLCIPEYTIEKISTVAGESDGSVRLAEDAIARMTAHWPDQIELPRTKDLAAHITAALTRRFSKSRVSRPSQKDVLDTVDDAVLGFTVKARDIQLDPISFNICLSWASQLALLDQSRYVEGWPGRTVWATARIQDRGISRRGFRQAGDAVVAALDIAFTQVAAVMPDGKASGFLPIHRVRACAAFAARVNRRLVNMILAQLLSGERTASYSVAVGRAGGTKPPLSEPIFTDRGERFFELMISPKEKVHAAERSTQTRKGSLGTGT
jgi:hypothetical protein